MARFRFINRITANSRDPEIRQLQQQVQDLVAALNITLNDLDAENIAPEFLLRIENAEQSEIQVIKNKEANVYMGTDGELFKIVDPVSAGGSTTVDPLSLMPVGYVYISTSSTSPQTLFGGTWVRIQGRFLLAADSTYAAGSTGGEAEVTLTVDQMPLHSHQTSTALVNAYGSGTSAKAASGSSYGFAYGYAYSATNTGGDQPHNNMPPYLAVYMWQRTA